MCNSPFFDVIMLKQNNFLLLLMIFSITHNIKSEFFFQNINDNHSSKKSPSRLGSMLSLLRIIGLSQNICLCLFTGFTHHLCSRVNPFPWVVMLAVP